jgi:hypothetical protein
LSVFRLRSALDGATAHGQVDYYFVPLKACIDVGDVVRTAKSYEATPVCAAVL